MREKLDCVKDHLEDSRAKVDAAEAEMRGVMLNLRERRRAGAHQRSVGELHELLHGVRIEQQRTQRSLAASQQLGRTARSTALSHILVGTYLRSLRRAWAVGFSSVVACFVRGLPGRFVERRRAAAGAILNFFFTI